VQGGRWSGTEVHEVDFDEGEASLIDKLYEIRRVEVEHALFQVLPKAHFVLVPV
jgi:hypothetical protein